VRRLPEQKGLPPDVHLRVFKQEFRRRNRQVLGRHILLRGLQRLKLRRLRPLMGQTVTIGTRGSQLALWQANWVKDRLEALHPGTQAALKIIKTKGDKILDVPLAKVGGKGLFVKEIEEALLDGRIDIAVHSMKDMPAEIPAGLGIGAVPERELPLDVLIAREGLPLKKLGPAPRIGTSSLRRAAQLRHVRPDVTITALRGNLDTRLRKLEEQELDAIVLAAAGIKRLGLADRITEILPPEVMLPAVGQGALCIETRAGDPVTDPLIAPLNHSATRWAVLAERAFLTRLEGGCQVPIAGYAVLDGGQLRMTGLVADLAGETMVRQTLAGPVATAETIGLTLAETLLAQGARAILDSLQTELHP
jgi:hydroxymethylbilane synthase